MQERQSIFLRWTLLIACFCSSLLPFSKGSAQIAPVQLCEKEQLLGFAPDHKEVEEHRRFELPVISYPFDSRIEDSWGLGLLLRIDEGGRVECYDLQNEFGEQQSVNEQRNVAIASLSKWRYGPFEKDGHVVPAVIQEEVREEERPAKRIPNPATPLEKFSISLRRTGCFGTCADYQVDIHGNGEVVYTGNGYVDVSGTHKYQVSQDRVAQLMGHIQSSEIWSLRNSYRAPVTDNPTYVLTMSFGKESHLIEDYVGLQVGMPSYVSEIEAEVDDVARSDMWIHLSSEGVRLLELEKFKFNSRVGASMLARAVANEDSHDDQAMLRLIELGTPIVGGETGSRWGRYSNDSLINNALRNGHLALIDKLIAQGALDSGGRRDQRKIDAAFRSSIEGAQLQAAQKIWQVKGDRPHPRLEFDDVADNEQHTRKKSLVTLRLSPVTLRSNPSNGLAITKWLESLGCDLKAAAADGTTLLHIAADANDLEFVRYLLDNGIDPSTPGKYGLPALGSTRNEDVAILLMTRGTDFSKMDEDGSQFRKFAEYNHWKRVVEWLDAHGK